MHTTNGVLLGRVAKTTSEGMELHWNLREWVLHYLRLYMQKHEGADEEDFAKEIDIAASRLSNIKNARRTDPHPRLPGLDVADKLNRPPVPHTLRGVRPSGYPPPRPEGVFLDPSICTCNCLCTCV